jgi:hypothetical protein
MEAGFMLSTEAIPGIVQLSCTLSAQAENFPNRPRIFGVFLVTVIILLP